MTQEKIINGNKLIAEFMGGKLEPFNTKINYWKWTDKTHQPYNDALSEDGLKFNLSWDWLMPVVEKIEKQSNGNSNKGFLVSLRSPSSVGYIDKNDVFQMPVPCDSRTLGETRIESVWMAVVNFIEWWLAVTPINTSANGA